MYVYDLYLRRFIPLDFRFFRYLSIVNQHAYRIEYRRLSIDANTQHVIASTDDIAVLHYVEILSEARGYDGVKRIVITVDGVESVIEYVNKDEVIDAFEKPLSGKNITVRLEANEGYSITVRYLVSYVRDIQTT